MTSTCSAVSKWFELRNRLGNGAYTMKAKTACEKKTIQLTLPRPFLCSSSLILRGAVPLAWNNTERTRGKRDQV